jgi:antirestriction protein ArdC
VVFWRVLDERDAEGAGHDGGEGDEDGGGRRLLLARGYSVFNADQVEGYEAPALPVLPEVERIAHADAFFAALGLDIRHGGSRACYVPGQDQVRMPPFEVFRDAVAYYATLAHEATHNAEVWTMPLGRGQPAIGSVLSRAGSA